MAAKTDLDSSLEGEPHEASASSCSGNSGTRLSDAVHLPVVLKEVAIVFFTTHISIFLLMITANYLYRVEMPPGHYLWMGMTPSENPLLRVWERWDSMHYLSILQNGYSFFRPGLLNTAFFPLFPLLGFIVNKFIGNPTVSLLLVSNAASFGGLVFAYRLAALEYGQQVARRTIFYVSIFPYAFFFAGIYTESLFLLNLAATLYYARTEKWGMASAWGILLTATRLVGIAVVPALLWEYMSQRGWKWKRIDGKILAIVAMATGLIGYMTYTYFVFGDFLSLVHSSTLGWDRRPEWPWVAWQNFQGTMERYDYPTYLFTGFFAAFGVGLVCLTFGRLRPIYVVLAVLLIVIPLSSNQVGGMPRYILTNLPVFLMLARLGEGRLIHMATTVIFLLYLAVLTTLHVNWVLVG
jgi:hypothetical protein